MGLLLSPMPDQGLSGGAETSRSLVISNNFSKEAMRLCRSASSCRGNSAWEMITWLALANQRQGYFLRLTFLLMNLCRLHVPAVHSYFCVLRVFKKKKNDKTWPANIMFLNWLKYTTVYTHVCTPLIRKKKKILIISSHSVFDLNGTWHMLASLQ